MTLLAESAKASPVKPDRLWTPEDYADLLGASEPTHLLLPAEYSYSDAESVLQIATSVGCSLYPHQQSSIGRSCLRRVMPDGSTKWASMTDVEELSRRNGKSEKYVIELLGWKFVFRVKNAVYSAHRAETSREMFERFVDYVNSDPELKRELKPDAVGGIHTAVAREFVVFRDGSRVSFRTRTKRGGKGLEGDFVIIDESQEASFAELQALRPILTGRSMLGDPKIVFGGTAGDHESEVLANLVRRIDLELARRAAGERPRDRLLLGERWVADLDVDDASDPRVWARTNPLLGRTMSVEGILAEFLDLRGDLNPRDFAMERLGVGDYPREEGEDWVIPRSQVEAAQIEPDVLDQAAKPSVVFAVEVAWDRQSASIVAAWRRPGTRSKKVIEVIEHGEGTLWTLERIVELVEAHANYGVVIDPHSPAASLLPALRDLALLHPALKILDLKTADTTAAFGAFVDGFAATRIEDGKAVPAPTILHMGDLALLAAFSYAKTRTVNGAMTWRRSVPDDVTPLLGGTWAAYYLDVVGEPEKPAALPKRVGAAARTSSTPARGLDVRTAQF